MLKVEGNVKE